MISQPLHHIARSSYTLTHAGIRGVVHFLSFRWLGQGAIDLIWFTLVFLGDDRGTYQKKPTKSSNVKGAHDSLRKLSWS